MKNNGFQKDRRSHTVLTVVFTIIAIAYLYPIFIVLVNSLKSNAVINLDTFAFPATDTFMGLPNSIKGMTFGNYPFYRSVEYSLMITLLSSALILICTSMAAWYISRVDSLICRVVYYLCVFSMVVPFQMVMFTLAKTADTLKLNRPWTIPIIYLGFGAGLAVFMFTGFVMKSTAPCCMASTALSGLLSWDSLIHGVEVLSGESGWPHSNKSKCLCA